MRRGSSSPRSCPADSDPAHVVSSADGHEECTIAPTERLTQLRRRAIRGAVLLASIAAVTLVLLAVAGGAAAPRIDLGRSSGGFTLLLDVLTIFVVAGSMTGLALLVTSFRVRKARPVHVEPRRRSLAGFVVLVAVIVVIALLPDPRPRQGQGPTVGFDGLSGEPAPDTVAIEPDRSLVVTSLLAATAFAALAALAHHRLDRQGADPADPVPEDDVVLRRLVLQARTDLEGVADPREAILHAYEQLRVGLRDAGLDPRVDDTPRQVVRRALTHADIPHGAVEDLVSAFEEARFSTHDVGADHRTRALAALTQIEASLVVAEPT